VLLTFITLMPGDLNLRRHVELFGEIVSRIIKQEKTFEVEYVFELAASEFSGSGSMAAVLMKHSMKAPVLADRLLQFCQQKNRELSRLLRTLAKNYKTVKFYDMCCEIAARLQQRPDQLVELFRSFVKPQVLKDIARDMMYCEGERVVKALLQNPKTNFTGTLNAE
jgi:poly-D-alanine transfer protein DltD